MVSGLTIRNCAGVSYCVLEHQAVVPVSAPGIRVAAGQGQARRRPSEGDDQR
jgi:hypothetical protein